MSQDVYMPKKSVHKPTYRSALWTLGAIFAPPIALWRSGRTLQALFWIVIPTILWVAAVSYTTTNPGKWVTQATSVITNQTAVYSALALVAAIAISWVVAVWATLTARLSRSKLSRRTGISIASFFTVTVILATATAAFAGYDTYRSIAAIFSAASDDTNSFSANEDVIVASGNSEATGPPSGRVNILLIGSDAGHDRTGTRPDTLMVASIDKATGHTVLISVPRNLQKAKFLPSSPMAKHWPKGFKGEDGLINAVWTWTESQGEGAIYPTSNPYPGLTATKDAIEGTLDLQIHDWILVNLQGFEDVINALGGVHMTVNEPIGVGKVNQRTPDDWIPAGTYTLDGYQALWYGRSRFRSDDYSRMQRQQCVVDALLDQTSTTKLATAYTSLIGTARENVLTSISPNELPDALAVFSRARSADRTTVALTDEVIKPAKPDFDKIQNLVSRAINRVDDTAVGTPTVTEAPGQAPAPPAVEVEVDPPPCTI